MFVRTTKNSAGQSYDHLVESYRKGGKVRQRTLLSLGRVEDGKLEQLAASISKHTGLLSALDVAKTIGVDKTYILGPLLVLRGFFEKLGIDDALVRLEHAHPKLAFAFRDIGFALVASRFVRPTSKLAVHDEQMLDRMYPDLLNLEHGPAASLSHPRCPRRRQGRFGAVAFSSRERHVQPAIVKKMREKFRVRRFIFVTDRGLTAAELFAQYKELWRIEDVFGELEGTLRARPVFHWKDRRIVGHLTMCFLALVCKAHVTRALREKQSRYRGRAVGEVIISVCASRPSFSKQKM